MFVLIAVLVVIGRAMSAGDLDFSIIDADGQPVGEHVLGLLLSRGDSVYASGFSDNSADAICREMGYARHSEWLSTYTRQLFDFDGALDDVVCSSSEWSSCTYSMFPVTGYRGVIFLSCTHLSLVDRNGALVGADKLGLLLYKGGTVCSSKGFSDTSADAICRLLGYVNHTKWSSGKKWEIQSDFNITLGNVRCRRPYWSKCSHRFLPNCYHFKDVFLQCFQGDWKRVSHGYIDLNMMETPLEILTDSNIGFKDVMMVVFWSSEDEDLGAILLKFRKNAVFHDMADYYDQDTVDLPTACNRGGVTVWRITLERETVPVWLHGRHYYPGTVVVHCNDHVVLRNKIEPKYEFDASGWEGFVYHGLNVTKISFYLDWDNVSRFYRPFSPQ